MKQIAHANPLMVVRESTRDRIVLIQPATTMSY